MSTYICRFRHGRRLSTMSYLDAHSLSFIIHNEQSGSFDNEQHMGVPNCDQNEANSSTSKNEDMNI